MIKWKKVDKNNPPREGKFLFFFDDEVFTGWPVETKTDSDGYPLWETAEGPYGQFAGVRYYAEYNRPSD